MPSEALQQLIDRVITDESFAQRLKSDREGALSEYQLTTDEREAVLSGDSSKLEALGLDQRVSKLAYQ